MKLIITGVSGLLGINLAMEAVVEHEVTGVDRGKLKGAPFRVIAVDFLRARELDSLVESADWVINCAALANLDECERHPDQARILNTDLPRELARACAQRRVKFVHLSTDAVFDGMRQGTYTEDDDPNPHSVYARDKLDGERAVQDVNADAIIARANFFGWSLSNTRSLGEFFVNSLREGRHVSGFTDVLFCPMWVNHLARTLISMLRCDLRGLYHVVGTHPMSKYEFGIEVARKFGLQESLISPQPVESSGLTAKRSPNLCLSVAKLAAGLGEPVPSFSSGLDGFYAQFRNGYPQQIRSYLRHPTDNFSRV